MKKSELKKQFIFKLADRLEKSESEIKKLLMEIHNVTVDMLNKHEETIIPYLCNIRIKHREATKRKNPFDSSQEWELPTRRKLVIHVQNDLKEQFEPKKSNS